MILYLIIMLFYLNSFLNILAINLRLTKSNTMVLLRSTLE